MVDEYASAVLVKPFDVDDFYRCVEHVLATSPLPQARTERNRAGSTGVS
jgi:hypothetical protein